MHSATARCTSAIAFLAAVAAAALGGCTGTQTSAMATNKPRVTGNAGGVTSRSPATPAASSSARSPVSSSPTGRWRVAVTRTPWQLPYPVSRAVATASNGAILLAGGLNMRGTSRASALWVRPANGRVIRRGRLPAPTHDAAGWASRGGLVVAGGGTGSSVATVEQILPSGAGRVLGSLPRRRSDSVAVSVAGTAYIVGGYDGTVLDPLVLASTDGGTTFHVAARLPVPVRYPAVAASGTTLWVVGGLTAHGLTGVVQQVDTGTGKAHVAGHLPKPLDAATAQAVGGKLIIFGGATRNGTTSVILTCAAPAVRCTMTGRLPYAVQNAAAATVGGHTYLLGGERNGVVLDDVATIDYSRS